MQCLPDTVRCGYKPAQPRKVMITFGSDNGLAPIRYQAIIWTNAGMLLNGLLATNFSEILIEICAFLFQENAFEDVVWKMAAILSRPQCVNP